MGTIKVGHAKEKKKSNEIRIYVGRRSSLHRAVDIDMSYTELGNPYRLFNESERDHVITRYRELIDKIRETRSFKFFINHITHLMTHDKDIVLCCWCHPKACHAHVLIDEVNKHISKEA